MTEVNTTTTPDAQETQTGSLAGRAFNAMREASDLSQRELARVAGVSSGYLSQVERGKVQPSRAWMLRVSVALGRHLAGVGADK